jgi:hypothetical protein
MIKTPILKSASNYGFFEPHIDLFKKNVWAIFSDFLF